jgi:YidC/Oxa1 family membrane protein insertase
MDQKRLILAIAISLAILLGFQYLLPHANVVEQQRAAQLATKDTPSGEGPRPTANPSDPGNQPVTVPEPDTGPRLRIDATRVQGSLNLHGGRLDDLVLRDYHDTVSRDSPLVQLLEPRADPQPSYVQFGWTAPASAPSTATPALPDPETTQWTSSGGDLTPGHPVTLSWDNGAGLTFTVALAVDADYMFTITQGLHNATGAPVALFPWSRIRRDYTPQTAGYYILHEGFVGVLGERLHELKYDASKKAAQGKPGGIAFNEATQGGWAGITDKYWLTALVPDQKAQTSASYRHLLDGGHDRYQVDFVTTDPVIAAAGADSTYASHLFAGAKVVTLLDRYETQYGIPNFDKAVDFGWFYFLTKPIFYALDWLNHLLGNFGLAIMAFTIGVKALFLPLASYSYRSMSKMKLLAPKVAALRERYKDEPAKIQQEMMAIYKAEKVNPASGCLPMLLQVPVFFCLYKDIFVTIEMRHAPFFGWIHDLSAQDPTNLLNAFGLIPFDPTSIAPALHLSAWTLIMGATMYAQQQLNPPPPDPMQAKLFRFMPLIFMFMMGRFPAGLVIYWSWNNTLTCLQQWFIMRQTRLRGSRTGQVART